MPGLSRSRQLVGGIRESLRARGELYATKGADACFQMRLRNLKHVIKALLVQSLVIARHVSEDFTTTRLADTASSYRNASWSPTRRFCRTCSGWFQTVVPLGSLLLAGARIWAGVGWRCATSVTAWLRPDDVESLLDIQAIRSGGGR